MKNFLIREGAGPIPPRLQLYQRGQTSLEVAVILILLTGLFVCSLVLLYMYFAKIWSQRTVYEAAICLTTAAEIEDCREFLDQNIEDFLLQAHDYTVQTFERDETGTRIHAEYRLALLPFFPKLQKFIGAELKFSTKESIALPLEFTKDPQLDGEDPFLLTPQIDALQDALW